VRERDAALARQVLHIKKTLQLSLVVRASEPVPVDAGQKHKATAANGHKSRKRLDGTTTAITK